MQSKEYDAVHIGHYTKDTIVTLKGGTRIVDGGGFNYGAHATHALGLDVLAVTRLAEEDSHVIDELENFGIKTKAVFTEKSTCLKMDYPTENPDERIFTVTSVAEHFEVSDIKDIKGKVFIAAPSFLGEMDKSFIKAMKERCRYLALDVQGFVRVVYGNSVKYEQWKEQKEILPMVDFFKVDIAEAEFMTGTKDRHEAAKILKTMGPSEIVLTHKSGILIYDGNDFYEAEFHPKELIGRSGRGDTCISTYSGCRLSMKPAEAVIWTAALASLKMEKEGPFDRTKKDVEKMIAEKYQQSGF
ncbi:MAG: PfkB family carbohydrate kinase [Spirochaetia bacterium]|jgi:sugar/nucleoside kinase (ribokinase family)|nr:PfkB family carbohydrate kinase [Spirochaetia bacterium]